jgi:hypothetical protein
MVDLRKSAHGLAMMSGMDVSSILALKHGAFVPWLVLQMRGFYQKSQWNRRSDIV